MLTCRKSMPILICGFITISFLLINSIKLAGQENDTEAYSWKNVQLVGGGFVSGIVFHPYEAGVCYCRTDMGGAYRWNESDKRWEPMLDWISYEDLNLMGVESIALDPSDPDRVYLACGTYTFPDVPDGAILRSDDRGKTFHRTNVPFKFGANETGRGNGERMAVDPNNSDILYLGTRLNGLWRSTDRSATWNRVESFPDVSENIPDSLKDEKEKRAWYWQHMGSGIIAVVFDPHSQQSGKNSSTIYVAVSLKGRNNLYRSVDFGESWQAVEGQPTIYRPNHMVLTSEGILYLTYGDTPGPSRMYNGVVWKYNTNTKEWTDITPDKPNQEQGKTFGYGAVSVDSHNPEHIIVSCFYRAKELGGEDIFRSTDEGKSWKPVFGSGGTLDYTLAPYTARTFIHWLFDIEIDPANPDHALFTTGFGGYETFNLTDMERGMPTRWSVMSTGIEETVALDLLSPSQGAQLITGIGDYGGFVHYDLDSPAPKGNFDNPHFGNTDGLACADKVPNLIVRVGVTWELKPPVNIAFSTDGGNSWQPCDSMPASDSKHGSVAVSSDGSSWIWTPQDSKVFVTHNNGQSWAPCVTIPPNTRVVADRVNPSVFYAMNLFEGKLYVSRDKGNTFEEQKMELPGGFPASREHRGDHRGGQDRLYATPGREGDLWIPAFDGLYHSTDGGGNFNKIESASEMHGFGFGKAAPGSEYPALYMVGVVNGVRGFFRSDNIAKHWVRINDDQHQYGLVFHITGDPKKYGRVYVGTHGRGTLYGDPVTP